jgi:hypothetical protein
MGVNGRAKAATIALINVDRLRQVAEMQPDLSRRLSAVRERAHDITESVRRLSHELHSTNLDHLGLRAAVRGFVMSRAEASTPAPPSPLASASPACESDSRRWADGARSIRRRRRARDRSDRPDRTPPTPRRPSGGDHEAIFLK